MAKLVQQSTASDPLFFFLTQSSDHISGLTGATPTVNISKNGAAGAAPAGAITQVDSTNLPGWYQVAGNATDTNTLGDILLHATAASADPCDMVVAQVVAFNPRNANLGLSDVSANVAQWNGTNVAAPATAGVPDVNVKNINNVSASPVTAVNANQGTTQPVNFTGTGAAALAQADVQDWKGATAPANTGDAFARLGAPVGASVSADIAAVKSDLDGGVTVAAIAAAATNVKKNAAQNGFMFVMTDSTTHAPKTGLTVTATRSLDGAAFAACANAPTEVGNGWYTINLAAADTNGNHVALRFTAAGADDQNVEMVTQP